MSSLSEVNQRRNAARAIGRCWGAVFFAVFGALWLLLAGYAFGQLNKVAACVIAAIAGLMAATALQIQRYGKAAAKNAYPEEERRKNDRRFGIVNAVTWFSVFLAFQICGRLGRKDLSIPVVVLIVGLHFFAMPPLYRHRANLVTGGCIALWAILCMLLFQGDRMIGLAALGAGLMLWLSAIWALKTAARLLRMSNQAALEKEKP